jgi:quercetin dioxygenase-like cupin family protein
MHKNEGTPEYYGFRFLQGNRFKEAPSMKNEGRATATEFPLSETTYTKWQRQEGVPIHTGFWADPMSVRVAPWERKKCLGAYINLADQESLDAYVAEIPPGERTKPERYMYEEMIYILKGKGATTVWFDGMEKRTFEWQEGSLFSPPLNCWRQHFNGQGSDTVRFVAITSGPHVINLFHNKDFIYSNPFVFHDRYRSEQNYFSGRGEQKAFAIPAVEGARYRGRVLRIWKTNIIPDVRAFDQLTDHNKAMYAPGAARSVDYVLADNTIGGHIVDQQSGFYKKAHRHGPGAHLMIVRGSGYSLLWEEGKERIRVDWKPGILFSPPDMWYHNHMSTGKVPARQLALRWGGEYKGVHKGIDRDYGELIEYEDEDPAIRKEFEEECRRNGVEMRMPPVVYRR